ncbi:MAG TPA: cytochrome c [Burkholderiaceae bacterium]|jgi:hypothetical protein|nr:cytochrome c [Burkholderiaceae bacterium]
MRFQRRLQIALALLASNPPLAVLCATPMTDRLVQEVAERQATTVEQALGLLSPSLRSHFALVFSSRSLQAASYADPRAVLFGNDARFVVTFNGNADQRGFDTLEIMEFDDQSDRFVFREILFSMGAASNHGAVVSEANPVKCAACHGKPLRPVWDTYPSWPGAYGEQYREPLAPTEADGLKDFMKRQPTHPRYRALGNVQVLGDPNTFVPGTKILYAGTETEPPNAVLSRLLAKWSARAIAHEVAASPRFQPYRYALLGTLSKDCGPLDAYFTSASSKALVPGLAAFSERSASATAQQLSLKSLRMQGSAHGPAQRSSADAERLDTFRFLVESLLDIPTGQWTPALEKGTFDFSAPQSFSAELDSRLRAIVAESDTSLQDLASLRDVGAGERYCRYLQARSRAATKDLRAGDGVAMVGRPSTARTAGGKSMVPEGRPQALKPCVACHEGGIGPKLPFSVSDELRTRLATAGYPRGTLLDEILYRLTPEAGQDRMPRGSILSADDRQALEDYFRGLAASPVGQAAPAPGL